LAQQENIISVAEHLWHDEGRQIIQHCTQRCVLIVAAILTPHAKV
jgi:hypothetical protein